MKVTSGLLTAFPDFKIDIQNVAVNGDQVTVKVQWSGTQSGPLSLPSTGDDDHPGNLEKGLCERCLYCYR